MGKWEEYLGIMKQALAGLKKEGYLNNPAENMIAKDVQTAIYRLECILKMENEDEN